MTEPLTTDELTRQLEAKYADLAMPEPVDGATLAAFAADHAHRLTPDPDDGYLLPDCIVCRLIVTIHSLEGQRDKALDAGRAARAGDVTGCHAIVVHADCTHERVRAALAAPAPALDAPHVWYGDRGVATGGNVPAPAPAPALDAIRAALTDEDEIAHGEAVRGGNTDDPRSWGGVGRCAYCGDAWPCRTQRGIDRLLAALAAPAPALDGDALSRLQALREAVWAYLDLLHQTGGQGESAQFREMVAASGWMTFDRPAPQEAPEP